MRLLFAALLVPVLVSGAELKDVKSVYLYPMVGGLDQHLAHRLTVNRTFRVVSDPKLADAIFTDQLGTQFEYRIEHIKKDAAPTPAAPGVSTETEPHGSTFSRGRGTVFLVDTKSRQVVWSDYRKPKNTSPHELDRTANALAGSITKTLNPAPAGSK